MADESDDENIFGEADGSTYTAVLTRTPEGQFAVQRLQVDGHNVPVKNVAWPSREQAVQAVRDYAMGDRKP